MTAEASAAPTALRPAHPPRARYVGILVGVALVALAVVGVREIAVHYLSPAGWDSWIVAAVEQARALSEPWLFWGGIGLFLVGLWLVAAAFVPRLKPYLGLSSPAAIWVRRVDLARHATATAKTLPGVLSASTLVTKKKITVTATSATVDETVRERLHGQLQESLGPLINDRLSLQVLLREDEDGGRF
ncbi:DUF6286 domain-containing protein [Corynebacterium sp.]|uniref:DUF6286 domain-containing protein n=1 Tax=Corynebacterium sp. TaxID=1720 RepID=UPI0037352493